MTLSETSLVTAQAHEPHHGWAEQQKVVAIIQARMGSTRFPGKVLAEIQGRPMLWHVVNRVRAASLVTHVVVATSVEPADDAIASFCATHDIACFRGSETDVLDRFYQAARRCGADVIVRITADCPFIDPQVIDRVISTYKEGGFDYVTNTLRYTYPDGLDTEVFSFAALAATWREARLPVEREHVTPYMRTSSRFRVYNVENPLDLSSYNLRWTVDTQADLEFVRAIYARLGGTHQPFGLVQVLELLEQAPGLSDINTGLIRNEGYYRSLTHEPPLPPQRHNLQRSQRLKAKAERLIPSCTQTFSKGPTQFIQGVAPLFLVRGQGSRVWDVDDNEYIDYPMALGPIILGHNYPAVTEAVIHQLRQGTTFSLPHPLEVEVAELLVETIPCAEMVRFGKNGSDVTSGAVRVARAYTGRDLIACCGYHGWADWYIGTTTRNKGVPQTVQKLTLPFVYNDIDSLRSIFWEHPGQVAAVIMEPIGVVEPHHGFLQQVRELTQREGALLIFDEVVTGFRLTLSGAQGYFGVTPDLACFGKAMANGYPLAAVVGRRDIMNLFDEVFFSFTFGGETLSLAAAKATIIEMREKNVTAHLWEQGQRLKDGYNVLAKEYGISQWTACIGLPPRTVVVFHDESGAESLVQKSLFQQECLKRGILFAGAHNLCFSHSAADVDYTLRVYRTAMEILADAIRKGDVAERLEGTPVQPVFRRP
jgi:glutamate-1-semialdehyde 2,1-aminomutase/spore coat polysaccharide biosynthesis protein SpsF